MQIVNLQIAPTSVKPVVHVSQSDVGRQFQLRLFDGAVAYSLPSGTTARIDGIKPDKEGFSYSDATSVSGNTITVTTKTQMTTTPGNVECEIRLVNNSQDIGTLNFIMLVEESPLSDVDISKTDLPDLIAEVRAAADTAVASATSASNSAESASGSATSATTAATSASTNGLKAEGYAVGKQNGADVPSGSEYYHNNAAYYANIASSLSSNPPYIGANGNWYVWNTSTSQYVDSGIDASITVAIADITMLAPNATPYVTNTGTDTDPIFHLFIPRGSGISSVTKTGTSGLVDTYTITYSDGSTTTFTVTNGKSAYDAAVDGGYDGTEAEFNADLAQFKTLAQSASTSASNASSSALSASNSATSASNKALDSEAWANGQRNGVDVPSTDPAYQNNAKYYKDQISGALNDVVGATASTNGVHGLVPAPLAGEQNKVLFGSGAWDNMDYNNLQNKPTLGTAAAKNSTNAVTQGSTALVESGAVSAEIQTLTNNLADEVETRAKTGVHNFWNNSAYTSVNHANASNNGFTNADADSRTEFWFRVRAFDASGTQIGSALASDEISSTGKKSYNMTVPNGTKSLDIRHNGAQVVIGITVPFNGEPGDYTMAFDLNGYNPTTVGGLIVQNIVLSLAADKATDFTPYAMTNRELTENKAEKSDLASISITGTTNNTGSTIAYGTYFYLNGQLVRAKATIANAATFTKDTNYEVVTAGVLNKLRNIALFGIATFNSTDVETEIDISSYTNCILLAAFTGGTCLTTPGNEYIAKVTNNRQTGKVNIVRTSASAYAGGTIDLFLAQF